MLTIKIETDNQAFDDDREAEIQRLLEDIIFKIANNYTDEKIHDVNGNTVGYFKLTK